MLKRVIGSAALGVLIAIILVANTDNPSVPQSVRFILSPGLPLAMYADVQGSFEDRVSKVVGIIFFVDACFYGTLIFIAATWLARRRRKLVVASPQNER
ncbi:MAG: hypothetical protein ACE145_20460 [Terriglobia bacterium]